MTITQEQREALVLISTFGFRLHPDWPQLSAEFHREVDECSTEIQRQEVYARHHRMICKRLEPARPYMLLPHYYALHVLPIESPDNMRQIINMFY